MRRFDISIFSELEDFTGRKQLDVSSFKLMRNFSSDNCRFKISRKQIGTKRVEVLASGDFEVSGGLVTFERTAACGLSDSSFLKEQGILAFEEGFCYMAPSRIFTCLSLRGRLRKDRCRLIFQVPSPKRFVKYLRSMRIGRKFTHFTWIHGKAVLSTKVSMISHLKHTHFCTFCCYVCR